jgi:hypothetical protein
MSKRTARAGGDMAACRVQVITGCPARFLILSNGAFCEAKNRAVPQTRPTRRTNIARQRQTAAALGASAADGNRDPPIATMTQIIIFHAFLHIKTAKELAVGELINHIEE